MGPQEREPPLPVNVRNIIHDPGIGGVAPVTVIPDCLFVQVRMTLVAIRLCFREHQGDMALPAFGLRVLSQKRHIGCVVIIGIDLHVQFPAFGTVTLVAGDLEIVPVRGICLPCRMNKQEQQCGQYQWQDSHVVDMGL